MEAILTMLPPVPCLDHAPRSGLRRQPDALEVGVDHLIPGLLVEVERRARRGNAGVVDEHGHRPEARLRAVERALDSRGIGDVDDKGVRAIGPTIRTVSAKASARRAPSETTAPAAARTPAK